MTVYPYITPSLHPDNIKSINGYDQETASVVSIIENAFSTAYEGINDIHQAREASKRNPTWNDASCLIHTDNFANKKLNSITRTFDSANTNITKAITFIENELTTPLTDGASSPLSKEIRSHVKTLNNKQRNAFLADAHSKGDYQTLKAILGAPAYLTGLMDEEVKHHTRLYHEQRNPTQAKKLQAMQSALQLMNERSGLVFNEVEKAVGASSHVVKRLRDAKSESEQFFILKEAL